MSKINNKRLGEYIQAVFHIILENDGSYPIRKILREIESRLNLNDYEKERYEKSGAIRWQTALKFYSIGPTKAGWLRKHKGVWYVTEE